MAHHLQILLEIFFHQNAYTMKKITAFLLITGLCLTQACNNANNNGNKTDSAGTTSSSDTTSMTNRNDTSAASSAGTTSSAPLVKDDSEFAVKAATGGMM